MLITEQNECKAELVFHICTVLFIHIQPLSPTHIFTEYGSYDATLIITDEFGQYSFPHTELIQILDLTGDINFDNAVDVVDIITLINLVLYPENDFLQDADLNEDGILSIIDIILLVNIILDN